jgi:hypothetical protein
MRPHRTRTVSSFGSLTERGVSLQTQPRVIRFSLLAEVGPANHGQRGEEAAPPGVPGLRDRGTALARERLSRGHAAHHDASRRDDRRPGSPHVARVD